MDPKTRLKHREREEAQEATVPEAALSRPATHEFATAEEALRLDRETVEVPGRVAERLSVSVGADAPPRASWWRRCLGLS